jgi:NADH:ubiquinone reductase (H+-translocating)
MSSNFAIQRPRVAIIGAGFGGLSAAKSLAKARFDVALIDRYNYHMFQPLLYQVATAALSPDDIAWPIRTMFRRDRNVRVVLANVSAIDAERNEVIAEANRIPFDYLIIATGARQAYFGHNDWARHAPGLKTISDAVYLRQRILLAFEKAETEPDPDERRRLLNFVIVGGGATGVELTGAIAELAKRTLAADFRTIDPSSTGIVLVEAGPRLLRQFDESLSRYAQRGLEHLGAKVRLGTAVTGCDEAGISMGTERIESRTIMWAAGVEASPAGRWLGAETDRAGRVKVEPDLSLSGRPNIFVLGDTAFVTGVGGEPLPGVAPVAKQQGAYVARVIAARVGGRPVAPFKYRDYGMLAIIGRSRAVAQFGRVKLSGLLAWVLWCFAHIYYLIGFRNRLIVMLNWAWNFLTFRRGARLIIPMGGSPMTDIEHADDRSSRTAREVG